MKRIFKYLMMTVIASATMFYSCETTELEDLVDPNALSPDLADADLLHSSSSNEASDSDETSDCLPNNSTNEQKVSIYLSKSVNPFFIGTS